MTHERLTTALCVAAAIAMIGAPPGGISITAQQLAPAAASATRIDEWLRSAEQLLHEERYSESVVEFARALDAARQLGHEAHEAQALRGLGEIDFAEGRHAQARERALKAADIYDRLAGQGAASPSASLEGGVGRANHLLSVIAEREGNLEEARKRSERAVAAFDTAGDRYRRGVATLQLLRTEERTVDRERALYDRVVADARAVSDADLEARAHHSFGDYLFAVGQFTDALAKLDAAAALFESAGRRVELGTVYNSLGRLYRAHGRVDAALATQLKALAIHESANAPYSHLQSLNAVGVTYQALGDFRRARPYLERAIAIAEKTSTTRIQDFLRANLASSLFEEGDYHATADILDGVVARGLDRYPSLRMQSLALARLRLGHRDVALKWAEKAVDACGSPEGVNCIYARSRRAEVHEAMGDPDAALTDLRWAMDALEAVRSRLVPADFFKQQFHAAREDVFSRSIALQLRGGRHAEALETAERARSRAFVDLLASRDLPTAHPTSPPSDRVPTASAATDRLPLVFRGAQPIESAPAVVRGDDLLSHTVAPPATSAQLAATAGRLRSTVLSYWVTKNQVFIWVTTAAGTVRSAQVDVRAATLLELIRATTPFDDAGRLASRQPEVTTRGAASIAVQASVPPAWRELYDLLIKPVRRALPRTPGTLLTIIPHGPLGALAFAGLQDERGRYLLEDYAIHYAPSGAALQFTSGMRRPDGRSGPMLMVADPVPPALSKLDRPLPRLPGARAESRAVAALMPAARLTRFEDGGASESAVRKASAGKAVLHFATHAIVKDDDPFSSFLALSGSAEQDDGLLTAHEIYRLRLDSDLVVLSACRSAGGRVTGDGIATFARAFLYAGTPSIIASLWDVADEPTNQLVPGFYRSWLNGASKARALRGAQLSLLRDLRRGAVGIQTAAGPVTLPEHPVFWAGFALIGEPE